MSTGWTVALISRPTPVSGHPNSRGPPEERVEEEQSIGQTSLFRGYTQFSVRPCNPKEGQERAGHVGVRAPNEHSLHFGKLGGQFVHRDLAVPPSRRDYTFG